MSENNYLEKITEIYAFVCSDKGGEGIIGHTAEIEGRETFMPFVCADIARMESLKPMAKQMGKMYGKKIKLIRLSVREELEEYGHDSSRKGSE